MVSFANRVGGGKVSAEDIVQQAAIKLLNFNGSINNIKSLFYMTVRNLVIDQARRKKVVVFNSLEQEEASYIDTIADESAVDPLETVVERVEQQEEVERRRKSAERIEFILSQLPTKQRTAFMLFTAKGKSYREISEVIGTTEGTVKSIISRARKKIGKIINNSGFIP